MNASLASAKAKWVRVCAIGITVIGFLALALNYDAPPTTWAAAKLNNPTWTTYTDPRYGFSLDYPADWKVQTRTDAPDAASEVLAFLSPESDANTPSYSISIGHYLYEIGTDAKLSGWTASYPTAFAPLQVKTTARQEQIVNGSPAIYVEGKSPITEYQYTNLQQGQVVWFIWANLGESAGSYYQDVYRHMVASFKFSEKTPQSLEEIYGSSFPARDLHPSLSSSAGKAYLAAPPLRPRNLGSSWWSPVLKTTSGVSRTVNCGSTFHTNGASYAADASMPIGTNVYAANSGTIEFWGWDTSGYGNMIKVNYTSNGYRHLYGHLNEINFAQPTTISRAAYLGKSGNTGTTDAHLHFHVQNGQYQSTSSGVTLVGMTGFTSNSNYPSGNAACGLMGR